MEFLLGPITWRLNVLYESRMKWTLHHSTLAVEEVSFFGGLKSGTPSTIIYTRWSSRRYELGCDAPVVQSTHIFHILARLLHSLRSMA